MPQSDGRSILTVLGGDRFEAYSAGLAPTEINPYTYMVMAEAGLDLAGQRSKSVDEYLGKILFQYLITVCDDADRNCPTIWPGVTNRLHWSFEDPAKFEGNEEAKLEKFREVRDLIQTRVKNWVENH